ncbi:alpha/beta-hydrolase family protein [Cryptosporangium aurantiacum]|uniref:Uncharacterized membrane protein n=1 Tax=Cryptosporangium aurantiacum TaxID=134849 RepID=A0A1M7R2Z7_9ACTN|nr:alpha/beta-hydrolase family protein [Cryptosporangium aurantiacum]SHN38995.1 Uncharacterized membrane protein [Cryptosporangium aurantiacum]
MRRFNGKLAEVSWADGARRVARWLNPLVASPAAPLETVAALNGLGPSLMPRTSALAGTAMGLSTLGARVCALAAEQLTRAVAPDDAAFGRRLVARAVIGATGAALAGLPQRDGQRLWVASLRSAGWLLAAGAAGGAVHDLGRRVQEVYPASRAIRPVAVSSALTGGLLWWGTRRLRAREAAVAHWPVPQTTTVPSTVASFLAVTSVATGLSRGFLYTRGALESYFGPEPSKRVVARLVNAGLWTAGASALYNAGVAWVGRANEKVEPAYATPPGTALVSGSPPSLLPFTDLGMQGRRHVTDVVTPTLIHEVMGEEPAAHPIRVYVGFNSEPLYSSGRAELALAELERTGAFDRSHLLLICPTGTGWVDPTLVEAAEFLTRGDLATCSIQYGRSPSFVSIQKLALGRHQFRLLLWGVKQRLAERPPERRPRVLIFGESLGAWASSDVVMFQGVGGLDHYGIDRALWVGLPWLAKWSRSGMIRGSSTLVPAGTVGVFDCHQQLADLDDEQRARLRVTILSHDNDPIAVLGSDLLVERPWWLADGQRGRGVPQQMHWRPLVTFVQTAVDAANAMVCVPGEFGSFGHDYRADMVRFVQHAYQLRPSSEEQISRVERALRSLDLERARRIDAAHPHAAPLPPVRRAADQDAPDGVPLRARRTRGAQWLAGRRHAPA